MATCVLAAGCTVDHHSFPDHERRTPVSISVSGRSYWKVLEYDTVVVASMESTQTTVLVDWTDHHSDKRHPGLVLIHRGLSFSGRYGDADAPFFVPDIPETQDSVWVMTADSALILRLRRGTYADIKPSGDPIIDILPVLFQASVSAGQEEVTVKLSGLYYILLPVRATTLRISYIGGRAVDSLYVEPERTRTLRYYDDVTSIEARTAHFGDWHIDTDATRLQVDIPAIEAGTDLFELDFDHSYKDRGQLSVRSVVHISH